jgi:hypothetical protein
MSYHLEHTHKSAVAEHIINIGNYIGLQNICILATETRYIYCAIRKAIETELHPSNMNREVGFCLSKLCKRPIRSQRDRKKSTERFDELRSP